MLGRGGPDPNTGVPLRGQTHSAPWTTEAELAATSQATPRTALPTALGEESRAWSSSLPTPGPQTRGRQDGREHGPAASGCGLWGPFSPQLRDTWGPVLYTRNDCGLHAHFTPTSDTRHFRWRRGQLAPRQQPGQWVTLDCRTAHHTQGPALGGSRSQRPSPCLLAFSSKPHSRHR